MQIGIKRGILEHSYTEKALQACMASLFQSLFKDKSRGKTPVNPIAPSVCHQWPHSSSFEVMLFSLQDLSYELVILDQHLLYSSIISKGTNAKHVAHISLD